MFPYGPRARNVDNVVLVELRSGNDRLWQGRSSLRNEDAGHCYERIAKFNMDPFLAAALRTEVASLFQTCEEQHMLVWSTTGIGSERLQADLPITRFGVTAWVAIWYHSARADPIVFCPDLQITRIRYDGVEEGGCEWGKLWFAEREHEWGWGCHAYLLVPFVLGAAHGSDDDPFAVVLYMEKTKRKRRRLNLMGMRQ